MGNIDNKIKSIDDKIFIKEQLIDQYKAQIEILEVHIGEVRREVIKLLKTKEDLNSLKEDS